MEHRHLNTKAWSAAAVDSALERGDLSDWQELFAAAQRQPDVAEVIRLVASAHDLGGASVLAKALVERLRQELGELTRMALR